MFCPDILALKQFYAMPLGHAVERTLRACLRRSWGALGNDTLLAVGFAHSYIAPYLDHTRLARAWIAMPAAQGAARWPQEGVNHVILADEAELPVADHACNRVFIIHAAEYSDHLREMMHEAWRVLMPGGRLLAVVPNRVSVWARTSRSPFGYGRPFSFGQWRDVLEDAGFTPLRATSALYFPPLGWPWLLKAAPWFERLGRMFGLLLGGVLVIEAEKRIHAGLVQPVVVRRKFALRPAIAAVTNTSPNSHTP